MHSEYICVSCGTTIDAGEFIAVIGTAPATGLSTPIGRADKIFDNVGKIYCADCMLEIDAKTLVAHVEKQQA